METFGSRLRSSRKAAKLSQSEVAKRIGMSQSLISELENDIYPTSGFTTQLAHLYKVSARWLAEGKGPKEVSSVELLDDEELERLLRHYSAQDDATKALVQHLLRDANSPKPEWMTAGVAAAIENARQLVAEQIDLAAKIGAKGKV